MNEVQRNLVRGKRCPRGSLLWLPVLLALFTFVYGLIDANERTSAFTLERLFLRENWRYGLSFVETIFDPLIFWGEIWFSLFIALVLAALWLHHVPPGSDQWKIDQEKTRMLFTISAITTTGILVFMAILPFTSSIYSSPSLFTGWWPTQASYQAPVVPVIIAAITIMVAPMKKYRSGVTWQKGIGVATLIVAGAAVVPWLVATVPAWWHPRGMFNFNYQLQLGVFTIVFPIGLSILFLTFILREPPKAGDGRKHVAGGSILLIASLALVALLQVAGVFATGSGAPEQIFDMDIYWWWPAAHLFPYMFIVSLVLSIVSGARLVKASPSKVHVARVVARLKPKLAVQRAVLACCVVAMVLPPVVGYALDDDDPPRLLVNQVGYMPASPKRVLFQAPVGQAVPESAPFLLVNSSSGEVVYNGTLIRNGSYYQHWYMEGNFTTYNRPGTHHVEATIGGRMYRSPSFQIDPHVYDIALQRAVDFFYYQRCGGKVESVVPGFTGHEACHLDDAMVFNGTDMVYKNLTGGWHDAGDYNKYNSWYYTQWRVTQALVDAWADYNATFFNLDDTRDSTAPDIIDEVLWGATYLVKCVDTDGINNGSRGLVVHNVVDWNYRSNKSAHMSYSGPPDKNTDNIPCTGDERVVFTNGNPWNVPWGWAPAEAGYGFAGTMLRVARVMEGLPYTFPAWVVTPQQLRDTAALLNETYYPIAEANEGTKLNGSNPWPHKWTAMARLLYEQETAVMSGDWSVADDWAHHILTHIYDEFKSSENAHCFADILRYYITWNRTIPAEAFTKIASWQSVNFPQHFVGPFQVFHVFNATGDPVLFSRDVNAGGGLINADHFWFAWFQALASHLSPGSARLDLIQSTLDYLFGMNPLGLCQMDGVGGQFVPQIHHRYGSAYNIGGRVPGGIINGIRSYLPSKQWAEMMGVDQNTAATLLPENAWVDNWPASGLFGDGVNAHSNEIWIIHDGVFMEMLTSFLKYHA